HFDMDMDGGDWDATGGGVTSAFPGLVTNSLLLTGFTNVNGQPTEGVDQIANHDDVSDIGVDDYQGVGGLRNPVFVDHRPGIIRDSLDDHETATRTDDVLCVWLSEPVADLSEVQVADFDFLGFDAGSLTLTVVAENIGSLCRLTFHGFTNAIYPVPGSRIIA